MLKSHTLYWLKQIFILLTFFFAINFVCNEYIRWNAFVDCQNKCQLLGIEKGRIQKTQYDDDVTLCRCLANSDYYVVLN